MGTLASMRPIRWVLVGILCLSLLGCGLINPRPPRAVVEGAIAQKLSQTQAVLHRQLSSSDAQANTLQVSHIRITDHRPLALAGQSAVEVSGTYQLQGAGLSKAQQRQTRPFDIYLHRENAETEWILVDPVN